MQRLRKQSLVDVAVESLRREVRSGVWGGRLPGMRKLAEMMGVSPPTVGEALERLADAGELVRGGERCAYRVPVSEGKEMRAERQAGGKRVVLLVPERFPLLDDTSRDALVALHLLLEEEGNEVMQRVLDYKHAMSPRRVWDQTLVETKAEAMVALYGRPALAHWAARHRVPILFLGGSSVGVSAPNVRASASEMLGQALEKLLRMGHTRVLLPLLERSEEFRKKMRKAFEDECTRAGVPFDPDTNTPSASYGGEEVFRRLVERSFTRLQPTAVVLCDMVEMVSLSCYLHERRLTVPGDVSVVMLCDSALMEWHRPALAHFSLPMEKMVRIIAGWVKTGRVPAIALQPLQAEWKEGASLGPPAR